MSKNKYLRTKLLGYHDLLESIPPQITHSWGIMDQWREAKWRGLKFYLLLLTD